MTRSTALRAAPTAVPAIGADVQAARSFERTHAALARSVAAPSSSAAATEGLAAELRGSLLLIAAVLLPGLVALALMS